MEIKLPEKQYNADKLAGEIPYPYVMRRGIYYIVMPDNATQEGIDAVLTIAQAHDPSVTDEQIFDAQAELALKEFSQSRKNFERVIPIVLTLDTEFHKLRATNQATIGNVYTTWRTIFLALSPAQRKLMIDFIVPFNANLPLKEPDPLTDDYRARFNSAIRDFCLYVALRSQVGK